MDAIVTIDTQGTSRRDIPDQNRVVLARDLPVRARQSIDQAA
jgi:hypothetical protein